MGRVSDDAQERPKSRAGSGRERPGSTIMRSPATRSPGTSSPRLPARPSVVTSAVMLLLNLLLGAEFPGFAYFISPIVTAMLWGPVNWLLYLPAVRRRREGTP